MAAFLSKYVSKLKSADVLSRLIPRQLSPEVDQNLIDLSKAYDLESLNEGLLRPAWDIIDRDAKYWRSSLCMMVSEALSSEFEKISPLAMCVELMHNGSLICDDIEDASENRRGKPCTYRLFGLDTALNAGNFLYFVAPKLIEFMDVDEKTKYNLLRTYNEEGLQIHLGQCTDIYWNKENKIPTEDQYYLMILNKTSVLARLAVRFALVYCQATPEQSVALIKYAEYVGIAFQIIDDIINLESKDYAKGRSYLGEDITEGKKTLIVIRTLQQLKSNRLQEILKMKTSDLSIIQEALDLIHSTDALQYSRKKSKEFVDAASEQLNVLDQNNPGTIALRQLAEFIISRVI